MGMDANPIVDSFGCCALAASGHAAAPPISLTNSRRFIFALIHSPRRRAAEIDVDHSTPNHLTIHVLERDYDINPRFSAFIGFVLHGYAHNDFRIFCARLRPLALNNFRLFDLSKQALHEYPS
jgi:hypothetical protein